MGTKAKHCEFCGKIFIPHRCVGARQRACNKFECKQKRKEKSQTEWCEKNPDYFKGRYPELKDKIQNSPQKLKKLPHQDAPPTIQDKLSDNNYIILTNFENIQDKLSLIFNETNSKVYQLKPGI